MHNLLDLPLVKNSDTQNILFYRNSVLTDPDVPVLCLFWPWFGAHKKLVRNAGVLTSFFRICTETLCMCTLSVGVLNTNP